MRRTLLISAAALFVLGCGNDSVKPGSLLVRWTQGPLATCGSRHVVQLEARAYLKNVLQNTATASCPANSSGGSMPIEELPPGNYTVEVEAFDAANKGVYLGTADKQGVSEGKAATSVEILLEQKPVQLNVTWLTPTGHCAGSPIRNVEVSVYTNAGTDTTLAGHLTGTCEAETVDPQNPSDTLAGLVFTDLAPNDDVVVIAFGLDASGNKIATAQSDPFILIPGDSVVKDLTLAMCGGTPPVCN